MAWNGGRLVLNPGWTTDWWYSWGDDRGAQFAQLREFRESTRLNRLTVTYYSLKREDNNAISYFVGARNDGPNVAICELVGGGLT